MTIFSCSLMFGHKDHFTSVYCQQKCDNVKHSVCLKCYYDEKMLFLFSADSDFIFDKNASCKLLRQNFKNKSDFFNYDFSFKPSAITRFCSSRVALRELDRERR